MNNLNDQQILEVENKYWADMWLALSRLKENKDFKHVILEGYFRDKAIKRYKGNNIIIPIKEKMISKTLFIILPILQLFLPHLQYISIDFY